MRHRGRRRRASTSSSSARAEGRVALRAEGCGQSGKDQWLLIRKRDEHTDKGWDRGGSSCLGEDGADGTTTWPRHPTSHRFRRTGRAGPGDHFPDRRGPDGGASRPGRPSPPTIGGRFDHARQAGVGRSGRHLSSPTSTRSCSQHARTSPLTKRDLIATTPRSPGRVPSCYDRPVNTTPPRWRRQERVLAEGGAEPHPDWIERWNNTELTRARPVVRRRRQPADTRLARQLRRHRAPPWTSHLADVHEPTSR